MKHKYYDMIVAKAANMELVRFIKLNDNEGCEWVVQAAPVQKSMQFNEISEYFLCLPQHKEAVLNALNGGESQLTFDGANWDKCNLNQPVKWSEGWWYMKGESQSRIKPKKEKVWVAYHKDGFMFNEVGGSEYDIDDRVKNHELSDFVKSDWQYKEIEVEG